MGNCLKINNSDDISLLQGGEISNTQDFAPDQNDPAPIYSVSNTFFFYQYFNVFCKY